MSILALRSLIKVLGTIFTNILFFQYFPGAGYGVFLPRMSRQGNVSLPHLSEKFPMACHTTLSPALDPLKCRCEIRFLVFSMAHGFVGSSVFFEIIFRTASYVVAAPQHNVQLLWVQLLWVPWFFQLITSAFWKLDILYSMEYMWLIFPPAR